MKLTIKKGSKEVIIEEQPKEGTSIKYDFEKIKDLIKTSVTELNKLS